MHGWRPIYNFLASFRFLLIVVTAASIHLASAAFCTLAAQLEIFLSLCLLCHVFGTSALPAPHVLFFLCSPRVFRLGCCFYPSSVLRCAAFGFFFVRPLVPFCSQSALRLAWFVLLLSSLPTPSLAYCRLVVSESTHVAFPLFHSSRFSRFILIRITCSNSDDDGYIWAHRAFRPSGLRPIR